jgi:hypothetical protein
LAIYALIAGLLLIVVSPLIRENAGSQINTNINQILLYVTTTTDAHLKKIFWSPSWIIYIISHRNVGAFFILWDESVTCFVHDLVNVMMPEVQV